MCKGFYSSLQWNYFSCPTAFGVLCISIQTYVRIFKMPKEQITFFYHVKGCCQYKGVLSGNIINFSMNTSAICVIVLRHQVTDTHFSPVYCQNIWLFLCFHLTCFCVLFHLIFWFNLNFDLLLYRQRYSSLLGSAINRH